MSRKCPECLESGSRAHLPGCSFAPGKEERERFIRENAVSLVTALERKVRRLAKTVAMLEEKLRTKKESRELAPYFDRHQSRLLRAVLAEGASS